MHRDVFAKNVLVANAQTSRLTVVLEILWRLADHATGVESIVRADVRVSRQMRVRPDAAIGADNHMLVNDCEWTNVDSRIELRLWMNDCSQVYHLWRGSKQDWLRSPPARKRLQQQGWLRDRSSAGCQISRSLFPSRVVAHESDALGHLRQ